MKLRAIQLVLFTSLCLTMLNVPTLAEVLVNESQRDIPVAYQTDVVVLGGGTDAVSAAVAAAESGAKVFLAAPRPNLGEDMTSTLRLWLEEGEVPRSPLALKIFNDPQRKTSGLDTRQRLTYKYQANRPSAPKHPDTEPASMLCDGKFQDPVKQSVQYDGNVWIDIDLGKVVDVAEVRVHSFQREAKDGLDKLSLERVTINGLAMTSKAELTGKNYYGTPMVYSMAVDKKTQHLRFYLEKGRGVNRVLVSEIEVIAKDNADTPSKPVGLMPRPLHVKSTLDQALLDAGVTFLYSCYPTDVLRDADGNLAGVVIANRNGRQAIIAKTIIDATEEGSVAEMAGAGFRQSATGKEYPIFRRTVIGGEPVKRDGLSHRIIDPPFIGLEPNSSRSSGKQFKVIEYTLRLPLEGTTYNGRIYHTRYAALAAADRAARQMTYHPEQQFTSDTLFYVPNRQIMGKTTFTGDCSDIATLPLEAMQPRGTSRLYVTAPVADVPRDQVEKLMRPLTRIDLGTRLGHEAAAEAKQLPMPTGVRLAAGDHLSTATPAAQGDVAEILDGVRPTQKQKLQTIPQEDRSLPVLGEYDVVVIGGGTAGAPAGIAAARAGAKTLVVEYLHGLGGTGTLGAITRYYCGNRVGFTKEIPGSHSWKIQQKMQWFRDASEKAGTEVWLGSMGCGTFLEKNQVRGAVVVTPHGRGVVLAKVVIDATGNADLAAAAGADCYHVDHHELAMQGTGLSPRRLGVSYSNSDFTFANESDLVDVWRIFVMAKKRYPEVFDQCPIIGSRERRRIVGEATVTILDQLNGRTYPDSVVYTRSDFDSHGFTVDPCLLIENPARKSFSTYIPYRCLLPRELDGLLVAALGMSAHRDAIPLIRMQADMQNQGYAAGRAAAMAAKSGVQPRDIDVKTLQRHLVRIGNLPENVLTDKDSYPLPTVKIAEAVDGIKKGKHRAAVIFSHPQRALPLLKKAYHAARRESHPSELAYAEYLCILGDEEAADTLIREVQKHKKWDEGWNYLSFGQYGRAVSPLDKLIMSLGRSGSQAAVPVILEKLKLLTPKHEFSHHRAVALALYELANPSAAAPLARLLEKPGMSGYAHTSLEKAEKLNPENAGLKASGPRGLSLRELLLTRALFRCGDLNDQARTILTEYTNDLRGHFAQHAKATLEKEGKRSSP